MKLNALIILMVGFTSFANAKIVPKTTLDVVDTAVCTAAAMKSQRFKVYDIWATELKNRYALIFPNKSKSELDEYTSERILDKKRGLERKGYSTKPAFLKFYNTNCKDFEPK
ncbi:hypothetical protein [Acinetobacter higginsii]|uniref:hypothetical protein n=1 Tax=Acinetobacter higginsii TaxID=70347 RepID=UPI001F4ABFC1|nr:hypothetical protein [Acinetobacter higginsii]MCH7381181.1 hypothetical protein [Acinetobacter higginsii]